jgi:hypothetical protein
VKIIPVSNQKIEPEEVQVDHLDAVEGIMQN